MISGTLSSEIENNDMVYEAYLAAISLRSECLEVGRMRGFSFVHAEAACMSVGVTHPCTAKQSKAKQSSHGSTWPGPMHATSGRDDQVPTSPIPLRKLDLVNQRNRLLCHEIWIGVETRPLARTCFLYGIFCPAQLVRPCPKNQKLSPLEYLPVRMYHPAE